MGDAGAGAPSTQRFSKAEAWSLLVGLAAVMVGGTLFLLAPVSHTETRWSPLPCWLLAAAGLGACLLAVGRANRRAGLPFVSRSSRDGMRDLLSAGRTAGIPIPVLLVVVGIGYGAFLLAFLHGLSATFTA